MPHDVTRLFLLRHANAASAQPGQRDFDRELDATGQREARFIADWMARHHWRPDVLITSAAARCRQTSAAVAERLGDDLPVETEPTLYEGTLRTYTELIASRPERSVMLVGHNPTIEELFWRLAGEAAARSHLPGLYPTAGLTVLDRDGDGGLWRVAAVITPER